jgi:hypothetical protein
LLSRFPGGYYAFKLRMMLAELVDRLATAVLIPNAVEPFRRLTQPGLCLFETLKARKFGHGPFVRGARQLLCLPVIAKFAGMGSLLNEVLIMARAGRVSPLWARKGCQKVQLQLLCTSGPTFTSYDTAAT